MAAELLSLLTVFCLKKDDYVDKVVAREHKPVIVATTEILERKIPMIITFSEKTGELMIAIVETRDCVYTVAEGKNVKFLLENFGEVEDLKKGEKDAKW